MLRTKDPISKEEVERCKQKDLLEEMLAEMTGEFPELSHVFVKERDIYLTYSLQMSAIPQPSPHSGDTVCPSYVVGVVGIGHVPGIKEHWGKVTEKDISPIMRIPETSLTSKIIRKSIRLSFVGLGIYGIYKVFPKSWIPSKPFEFLSTYFRH
jgi:pheromone shutdown protein TraB